PAWARGESRHGSRSIAALRCQDRSPGSAARGARLLQPAGLEGAFLLRISSVRDLRDGRESPRSDPGLTPLSQANADRTPGVSGRPEGRSPRYGSRPMSLRRSCGGDQWECRPQESDITLAPKKLIRTRRASEGSASEPSLARRVSMCKDAKISCRGNNPLASQGPLDGRVGVAGSRTTLNREVLERVIPSGITYSWERELRWRIRRSHGADVDGT